MVFCDITLALNCPRMARLCDFHCHFTMLQSHLWLYKVSKMGEGDLVLMSIDAFEKREQTLQLHANVLQAEIVILCKFCVIGWMD